MKTRYTTIDIIAALAEINNRLIGMRVNQIYDVDHKTYLIRLQKSEEKAILLLESGIRVHTTDFQWPKNPAPSGFSMKLRKHLNNKRLEKAEQLGTDRIVDLQFGTGEATYHIILELYDRGNVVLTDYNRTILNILRPRTEGEDVRFAVKETYPSTSIRTDNDIQDHLNSWLTAAKNGDNLKKILVPKTDFGPALIEHVLLEYGFAGNSRIGKDFDIERDTDKLLEAMQSAKNIMRNISTSTKGYIIQKKDTRPTASGGTEDFLVNQEFHPFLFKQHEMLPFQEFPEFNQAVDQFFSQMESQKLDMKVVQQEREAMKKLHNIRQDHDKRLAQLHQVQKEDEQKARLIELNQPLVDRAIFVVRSALANQIPWKEIEELVEEATRRDDPVAKTIKKLKLQTNHITLELCDPFAEEEDSDEDWEPSSRPMLVDVDLDLTAFANARKYFDDKRNASKKEQKTLESSNKAFKSAEKKAKQTLKESATIGAIRKARKVLWFEKFYWFISSDNYLVVGGRDRQQNELLVKRYLKSGDVYVHADLHGASSVVIKNPSPGQPISPRTLQEAGLMAVCYSAAWEAKVMTTAWWVESSQVSKTAPSGEYLTTGSFMIRGKKNFLPPLPMVFGFGLLFRLEDGCVARHLEDRKPKGLEDDAPAVKEEEFVEQPASESEASDEEERQEYSRSVEAARSLLESNRLTNEPAFPDTVVDLSSAPGRNRTISAISEDETYTIIGELPGAGITATGPAKSAKKTAASASKNKKPVKGKISDDDEEEEEDPRQRQQQHQQVKRGQKGKLKKIKEKYKDQDEEERKLRMQLLQSAGPAKDKSKGKGKKGQDSKSAPAKSKPVKAAPQVPQQQEEAEQQPAEAGDQKDVVPAEGVKEKAEAVNEDVGEVDGADEADEVETSAASDVDILNALTGIPVLEDELLYALPVVAPYSTLTTYKFKVKIIPGQAKRGKAAKTALSVFIADKTATSRERDLVKSLKDQDIGRNLPGRVKLAVPQSLKPKK